MTMTTKIITIEIIGLQIDLKTSSDNFNNKFIRIEENAQIRKELELPECFSILHNGKIVESDDTPRKLHMQDVEQVLILTGIRKSILTLKPHRTSAPRDVMILAENEFGGDIRFSWEDLDLGISVREFKSKMRTFLKDHSVSKDIWKDIAVVHNEMVLDDNDELDCAGVNRGDMMPNHVGVVRGSVLGMVNLKRLARGSDKQKHVQAMIIKSTATKYQAVTKSKGFPIIIAVKQTEENMTDLYVGPSRNSEHDKFKYWNSKESKQAFIVYKGEGLVKKTRVKDLINDYSNVFELTMKRTAPEKIVLRFNNQILRPEELVVNVLKCGYTDQKDIPFKNNYFVVTQSIQVANRETDTRSIDELLNDIEEPIQEKTKKKKKKPRMQQNGNKDLKADKSLEPNLAVEPLEPKLAVEPKTRVQPPTLDLDGRKKEMLATQKSMLELELKDKQRLLKESKQILEDNFSDLENLLDKIEEVESDDCISQKNVDEMELNILNMEKELEEMKKSKEDEISKIKTNQNQRKYLLSGKVLLEEQISVETQRLDEVNKTIKDEITQLETKIVKNLKTTLDVYNKKDDDSLPLATTAPDNTLLNYLISKKEKELECPVCLVPATVPIYSCVESHLICNTCRPKVTMCPECRVDYKDNGQLRRHRYAERLVEELDMLRKEKR